MNTLTVWTDPGQVLIPSDADKHARSRLGRFVAWLQEHGTPWHDPDLAAYRDAMLADGYAASTVSAHLSTVRAQYQRLLRDNDVRDGLEIAARDGLEAQGDAYGPADVEALVKRKLARLENATDAANSPVKTRTRQDVADSEHLRLTSAQASALLAAPGVGTLQGLRDTAVIAVMLCTGIREAELCALDVADLRQRLGGELALHVREGKGCKERLIPYGDLDWVLAVVDAWLRAAGIESGPVFRGLYKSGRTLRPGRLSVRAVQYILARYPVTVGGELVTARPHDLRRTYARRLYEAGMDLVAIQQNLGHADVKTTLGYIGTLDAEQRRAPAVYTFDLNGLYKQAGLEL
jgi:site-specific recombinase XerD